MKRSKRYKELKSKIEANKIYSLDEAVKLAKETSAVKFDAAVEIHIKLGIDPKKGDQVIRSSVVLPHGTGKTKKVVAFVTPAKEKEAKTAGADLVGGKDLIEQIKKDNKIEFEVAVAMPEIMKDLSVIAKLLGQKGLMPNPKVGTVTNDIAKAVKELKAGKLNFRNDDTANVHLMVGRVSFDEKQLKENIEAFLEALKKAKPESLKGSLIKSAAMSTSMGPGFKVQVS